MSSTRSIKDLPIYGDLNQETSQQPLWVVIEKTQKSELESLVSSFRQNICNVAKQFQLQKDYSLSYFETSKENLKKNADYIRSETNILPKIAFISLSGLSGLLIGYKKSNIRKALYTTLLTSGSAALCYPKEARFFGNKFYELSSNKAEQLYRTYIWPEENKSKKQAQKRAENIVETKNLKDTVVKLDSQTVDSAKTTKNIAGDKGQSTDEDKDMYTTRK